MKEPRKSLLYAIGRIDDEWIADVVRPERQTKIRLWMKYAVAACLALAVLVCVPAIVNSGTGSRGSADSAVVGDLIPMLYVNGTVYYALQVSQYAVLYTA